MPGDPLDTHVFELGNFLMAADVSLSLYTLNIKTLLSYLSISWESHAQDKISCAELTLLLAWTFGLGLESVIAR